MFCESLRFGASRATARPARHEVKLCFKPRDDGRASDFRLDIQRRGETKPLHTEGFCRSGSGGLERGVSCNVECDGGGAFAVVVRELHEPIFKAENFFKLCDASC